MPTVPTPHTPLPPAPSIATPATFNVLADAFVGAQEPFGDQMDALAQVTYDNAVEALGAVTDAAEQVDLAEAQVALAAGHVATTNANVALTAADVIATGQDRAAVAADKTAIENLAAGLSFTSPSTTSVTLGTGSKTWTVDSNESFEVGMPIYGVSASNAAKYVSGVVSAYDTATGVLSAVVSQFGGSGAVTDWNISIGGIPGPPGATFTGGNLSGGLNEAAGSVAIHATAMDLFGVLVPNLITATGSATTLTDFLDAAQAGAERQVLFPAGTVLTNNANISVQGGANYTVAAGDIVTVRALTVSTFQATVQKGDGTSVGPSGFLTSLSAKTANYAVAATDKNKIVQATGANSWTLTLPDAATFGVGAFRWQNDGTGEITLARTGANTIDGLTGYKSYAKEVRDFYSDGSNWTSKVINSFDFQVPATMAAFMWPPGYLAYDGEGVGGGSGASCAGGATDGCGGGGGYGDRFSIRSAEITPGATEALTIGAGGLGGTTSPTGGTAGGTTSIGSLRTFPGGKAGTAVTPGYGGAPPGAADLLAGSGFVADDVYKDAVFGGGTGGKSGNLRGGNSTYGGAGGASGNNSAPGLGGTSLWGSAPNGGTTSGNNATNPGAGGSGGYGAGVGGNGFRGQINIRGRI